MLVVSSLFESPYASPKRSKDSLTNQLKDKGNEKKGWQVTVTHQVGTAAKWHLTQSLSRHEQSPLPGEETPDRRVTSGKHSYAVTSCGTSSCYFATVPSPLQTPAPAPDFPESCQWAPNPPFFINSETVIFGYCHRKWTKTRTLH